MTSNKEKHVLQITECFIRFPTFLTKKTIFFQKLHAKRGNLFHIAQTLLMRSSFICKLTQNLIKEQFRC